MALIDPYCSCVLKEKNRLAQSNIFDLAKVFVACSQYLLACRPSKPKRHCWRCLRWNAQMSHVGKGEPQRRSYRLMSFNEVVHLSRLLLRIPKVFRGLRVSFWGTSESWMLWLRPTPLTKLPPLSELFEASLCMDALTS